ncbi:DUF4129 domain-containing protein [Euzebya tangerina]|uniref:DUF4129 domain-containing protein n=1 Tax=Euzebya tangerina TaxID=591198 RepID=UPI000E324D0B|nr:DUF4129 domain-containing protein [Euzebya tangerina]
MRITLAQSGPSDRLATPEEIRQVTEEVLARADYRAADDSTFLGRVLESFFEQLGRLLLRVDGTGGFNSVVAAVGLTLLVIALVVLLILFLRRFRRSETIQTVVEGPVGRPAASWADEAVRYENEGDLRQAMRCRYRETLARLAAADLVDEVPGRTTGEYRAATRSALPAAAPAFDAFTDQFEDVWYGGGRVDRAGLEQAKQHQADVAGHIPSRRGSRTTSGVGA